MLQWTILLRDIAILFAALSASFAGLLTLPASIAAGVMAIILWHAWGVAGLAPALFFLISSSLWTRWPGKAKREARLRSLSQVFANGSIGTVSTLLWFLTKDPVWLGAMIGSFSAATADTWSSEWGRGLGGTPLSLRTLQRVQAGDSGAISLVGTIASLAGALSVAGVSLKIGLIEPDWFSIILLAGFAGGMADSFAGAWFQAQWLDKDGSTTETRPVDATRENLIHGLPWVNNDVVNLVATGAGAILAVMAGYSIQP